MKYICLLLCLSIKNVTKADGPKLKKYERGQFSGHVVGGVEVPIAMYPHVAVLIVDNTLCGGSIVSDRLIVTAGHCVYNLLTQSPYEPEEVLLFLGTAYLGDGEQHEVCKVIPHNLYRNRKYRHRHTPLYFYDIAVLMLSKRIKFGPAIQKIDIAPKDTWRKEKYHFTIAGFGLVETGGGGPSKKLLANRMHYVDSRTCNQSQSDVLMIVPDHMFCMIGLRWTSDCFGDSGSGVIWRRYLVGIVSTGRESFCGADMVPSMYTDASYFQEWIQSKISEADSLRKNSCPSSRRHKKLSKFKTKHQISSRSRDHDNFYFINYIRSMFTFQMYPGKEIDLK